MTGHRPKLDTVNAPIVTALREIEEGLVGREYLKRVRDVKGDRDRASRKWE
jgi:DNA-directed RNA polymerase subunit K/omega